MMRRVELAKALSNNPGTLARLNAASMAVNHRLPAGARNAALKDLLANAGKTAAKTSSNSKSSDSPVSGVGYIFLLLSSILLLTGWFGSWMGGGGDNGGTTTVAPPDTTTEAPMPSNKYNCDFGFQGRLCERKSPSFLIKF